MCPCAHKHTLILGHCHTTRLLVFQGQHGVTNSWAQTPTQVTGAHLLDQQTLPGPSHNSPFMLQTQSSPQVCEELSGVHPAAPMLTKLHPMQTSPVSYAPLLCEVLRRPDSRTVRQYISVVQAPWSVVLCDSSHGRLIECHSVALCVYFHLICESLLEIKT